MTDPSYLGGSAAEVKDEFLLLQGYNSPVMTDPSYLGDSAAKVKGEFVLLQGITH